jgi:hypothetical protein
MKERIVAERLRVIAIGIACQDLIDLLGEE